MATVTLTLNVGGEKAAFNYARGMLLAGSVATAEQANAVYAAAMYAVANGLPAQNATTKQLMHKVGMVFSPKTTELVVLTIGAYNKCIEAQKFGSVYAA